jgi:hypothetical protein
VLGNVFYSDLLLLRFHWPQGLAYEIGAPWMREACESLAQALSIAATRILDVATTELRAGWAYTQEPVGRGEVSGTSNARMVDFYLYDTLSGGAGYANQMGTRVIDLLERAQYVLDECPDQCERSCYRCLRSYENRVLHDRLDRKLAGDLLRAIVSGAPPTAGDIEEQERALAPLANFLELAGFPTSQSANYAGVRVPLLVRTAWGEKAVGVRSALADPDMVAHPLDRLPGPSRLIVSEYEVARNLPGVAERLGVQ